jgi:hypothetical protein
MADHIWDQYTIKSRQKPDFQFSDHFSLVWSRDEISNQFDEINQDYDII